MHKQKAGSLNYESGCCGCWENAENNLSSSNTLPEKIQEYPESQTFEVIQKVNEINRQRKRKAPGHAFTGESYDETELLQHPEYAMTYIAAPPRMAHYLEISTEIYNIYLKYISPKDIHVYSIDEVFLDVTGYLKAYQTSPRELAKRMILDILNTTGITATAGIGTNLYLCKVAMDIVAKRIRPDADGVRIAQLDEIRYRKLLWKHQPLTDFWRIGKGFQRSWHRLVCIPWEI